MSNSNNEKINSVDTKAPSKTKVGYLALVGALLFRIRGGWDIWFGGNLPANKIYYPIFIGLCYGWLADWNWLAPILGVVLAYLAQQICGWGAYRGALIAGAAPAEEVRLINWVLSKSTYVMTHNRLWGFLGCSLRGLISSFFFGLLSWSPIVGLCGLLVGFCYLIPVLLLWNSRWHNGRLAWDLGEFLEGALYVVFILLFTPSMAHIDKLLSLI